jgi:hypothetical protein
MCLNLILRRIFGAKRKKVAGSRLVLRIEEFIDLYVAKLYYVNQINKVSWAKLMGRVTGM